MVKVCRLFDREKNRFFIVFFWLVLFFSWFWFRPATVSEAAVWAEPEALMPEVAAVLERQLMSFYPATGGHLAFPSNAHESLRSTLHFLDQSAMDLEVVGAVLNQIFVGTPGDYLNVLLRCYQAYQSSEQALVNSFVVSIDKPLPNLDLTPLQKQYFGEPLAREIFPWEWSGEPRLVRLLDPFADLISSPGCGNLSGFLNDRH